MLQIYRWSIQSYFIRVFIAFRKHIIYNYNITVVCLIKNNNFNSYEGVSDELKHPLIYKLKE